MKLGIVLLTYSSAPESPRTFYADQTVRALINNIKTEHEIHFHIADDGSYEGHVRHLETMAKDAGWIVTKTNAERGGYGKSYNLASQFMHSDADYMLMIEDDWELTREFRVDPLIDSIKASGGSLGCIRLGYVGTTAELNGTIKHYGEQTFLQFMPDSPERHIWTGHPRLESVAFQRQLGEWPEGLGAGETEVVVANRKESRVGVAWPLDIGIRAGQVHGTLFAHIGETKAGEGLF